VTGPQNKRAWTFRKAARPSSARLEDPGISASGVVLCGAAERSAGDSAKKASERAPHYVGGCSGREPDRIDGLKVKPQAEKLQLHVFF
jgi:hypothetical protein